MCRRQHMYSRPLYSHSAPWLHDYGWLCNRPSLHSWCLPSKQSLRLSGCLRLWLNRGV
ncbi:hypothetical protein BGZ61DRAFT_441627 [Ilyonectria robusta]|uniref:uncharacterized protein n=1 Tax=Ilyonectria robusta TaxID=1079257 RepID=UPI001E8D8872|nr:uncharacterized protein BGZ61DRAFT_441627 [Ilyonectria robusta]KAH8736160.1 hypothetical protein BGZ61DRAFT_441627 [Ilyonectria robusta]